jgi:thiol-disulfide isomerase/thioredoxin
MIRKRWFVLAALAAATLGAIPVLRLTRGPRPADPDLVLHARPKEVANLRFSDGEGRPTSLAAFHGRFVLLNVWATWCPPCVEEMPTLDRLQAMLGGPDFEVIALSIDHGDPSVVRAFFDRTGIKHLHPYMDTFGDTLSNLAVAGVPLTLFIDREGREIGRKSGPAAWHNPRMVELIRRRMAADSAPSQAQAARG